MDVSSVGGASLAALMSGVNAGQARETAVAGLVKEQMQQEGQQVLQLIQSAAQSSAAGGGDVGSKVDVMV